jgi:hypothetical protein
LADGTSITIKTGGTGAYGCHIVKEFEYSEYLNSVKRGNIYPTHPATNRPPAHPSVCLIPLHPVPSYRMPSILPSNHLSIRPFVRPSIYSFRPIPSIYPISLALDFYPSHITNPTHLPYSIPYELIRFTPSHPFILFYPIHFTLTLSSWYLPSGPMGSAYRECSILSSFLSKFLYTLLYVWFLIYSFSILYVNISSIICP